MGYRGRTKQLVLLLVLLCSGTAMAQRFALDSRTYFDYGNQLTIMSFPCGLTCLTTLYLDGNLLTSLTLPDGLTSLTTLQLGDKLFVRDCRFVPALGNHGQVIQQLFIVGNRDDRDRLFPVRVGQNYTVLLMWARYGRSSDCRGVSTAANTWP